MRKPMKPSSWGHAAWLAGPAVLCGAVLGLVEHPAAAGGATIEVRVLYRGEVPPPTVHPVERDQKVCGTSMTGPSLLVEPQSGSLQGAVVALRLAPETAQLAGVQPPVVLTNRACRFVPHMVVAQVGQVVELRNDDPVLHNTHIESDRRTFINVALIVQGNPVQKRAKEPGVYRVRCDAHEFMEGSLMVFDHPYAAMTDEGGAVRIAQAPPGRHTVEVWHETLGILRRDVTIPETGTLTMTFEYVALGGRP